MALAASVELPAFGRPRPATEAATIWIATDDPPARAQAWPLQVPVPDGWHEVPYREALRIQQPGLVEITFGPLAAGPRFQSEAAALSTAAPDPFVVAARSLSRTPREPRPPRPSRAARPPRAGRPPRAARAPRPPRRPRRPRRERLKRQIRKPRPRNYKTREKPPICKGPACTCWTPGGCVGAWYLEALPSFAGSDCFRGPCYSYEACVTDQCQVHAACAINTILQFWARQYRAVVAYAQPVAAAVRREGRRLLTAVPATALAPGELAGPGIPAGAFTDGCPAGWYWAIGLTGVSCASPESGRPVATAEQLISILGYDPRIGPGG